MSYCLAIDIGASSGRHLIGTIKDGKLITEEIYRFENGFKEEDGFLVWDTELLFENIILGLKRCKEIGKIPDTVAIDTWGVDYVLLDGEGKEILPAVSYRDTRTEKIPEEVFKLISKEELYSHTGIQIQNYNTIFQLYCDKKSGKLDKAKRLLMMPEYLSYKLTGKAKHEYTICSTTGLLNAKEKCWDKRGISALGIDRSLFGEIYLPPAEIGTLTEEVQKAVGFDTRVVFAPAHDTASAVAACPTDENAMFISSGTWSLVGTENADAFTTKAAMESNFTNEGGIEYRFRFLKNIMGMWLFQSIRRELQKKYSYDELMNMAKSSSFKETFDPQSPVFLSPDSMIDTIRIYFGKEDLPLCDVVSSVYHSLATSYKKTVLELEEVTGKKIDYICIVGGGSKDEYLNCLTKEYTQRRVLAGPVECTAFGNLLVQHMLINPSLTLSGIREIVKNTFADQIREYN